MTIHFQDDSVTLHSGAGVGGAMAVLRDLADESINCCVTSPPYFGLRSYLPEGHPDKAHEIGTEATPAEFVEKLRALFAEVRRVLAKDGTLWLNLGDSYYSGKGSPTQPDLKNEARRPPGRVLDKPGQTWASPKNLLGIPWRVAFALQDDGWILRNSVIWSKPNAMPESVTDRLSSRHENLFLFSKSRRYWFDLDPIREPVTTTRAEALSWAREEQGIPGQKPQHRQGRAGGTNLRVTGARHRSQSAAGRNPGDVWTVSTQPFPGAHFATMPPELARRCVVAGCKPDGVVLDPFSGSGTTGMVAQLNGRKYIGIDLNPEYLDLSLRTRLTDSAFDFEGGA